MTLINKAVGQKRDQSPKRGFPNIVKELASRGSDLDKSDAPICRTGADSVEDARDWVGPTGGSQRMSQDAWRPLPG